MAEMVNRPNPPPPQPPRRRGARGDKIPAKNKEKWYKWVGGIKYKMNVGWVEA
jgi:hypothetical protein